MPKSDSNDSNQSNRSWQLTGSSTTSDSKPSWLTRAANIMRPNFGRNTPGRSGSSRITKLIFGTLLFVLVGQLLVTGLTILDSVYKLGLQAPVFAGAPWLSWFFLIYFVLLIGLWIGLNYLGFFPKPEPLPPAGSRNRSSSNGASGGSKNATQIPGIGGPRARPRAAAPPPPPPPPSPARRGISGLGSMLGLGPSKAPAATAVATKTTKTTSSPVATANRANRAYDESYERVKAARRQKRRRSAR